MMPATADLIALRDAFDCDTDYLLFVEGQVCTCLSGTQSGAILQCSIKTTICSLRM